jgi:hypothetical protein
MSMIPDPKRGRSNQQLVRLLKPDDPLIHIHVRRPDIKDNYSVSSRV